MTRERWAALFGIDLRSLALFRIAVAALILVDLARRAGDFTAFYTEAGVFPVELARALAPRPAAFSLHVIAGASPLAVAALFALAAAAAVALAVGWHARIATAVSWALLVSLHARNPWLASMGGDALLRLFLFWGLFLPLGARMSLDARRNSALRAAPDLYVSAASAALLGQICLVYFATGAQKSGELWADGTAVRYALELDPYATRFGTWLLHEAAWLLPIATHGVRWFERLGPLLAFAPIATGPLRTLTVALFFAFHLALAAGLDVGIFPAAAMAGWLAFLPAWFWDVLLRRDEPTLRASASAPIARRWPVEILVGALFAWVVVDVGAVTLETSDPFPGPVRAVGSVLRLNQYWTMFSPNPPVYDTWIERIGETGGGVRIDVALGRPATSVQPERSSRLESWSWRVWLGYLQARDAKDPLRAAALDRLAAVSCGGWNATHSEAERIEMIQISQVIERTLPVGSAPLERVVMLRRSCASPDQRRSPT